MIDQWLLAGCIHYVCVALALSGLYGYFPGCITIYLTWAANFFLCMIISRLTFEMMKKCYFQAKVERDNKAVFITGCDSGFGYYLAKRLDRKGFHVFAGCLFPTTGGASELKEFSSKRLRVLQLDVTQDDSVRNAVDFVKINLDGLELWAVVNNAGILRGFQIEFTPVEDYQKCMEVNAIGVVRVTKAFLPLLRQFKGRVINLVSIAGRVSAPYLSAYTMSKFATTAFGECLRQELADWGIRVISIEPEFFKTPLTNGEVIYKTFSDLCETADDEVKDSYGEKYLGKLKKYVKRAFSDASPNVDVVIDALESAVTLVHPPNFYKPCRNIGSHAIFYLIERIPKDILDFSLKVIATVNGIPKPKGTQKPFN